MAPTRACAAPLLSAEEWVDLGDAFSSWVLSADGRSVSKRVVAKHWAAAMAYLNLISEAAEAASHHPDVHLTNWRHVTVTLTTHATGGLTRQDASLAATIDALPLEASPRWLRDANFAAIAMPSPRVDKPTPDLLKQILNISWIVFGTTWYISNPLLGQYLEHLCDHFSKCCEHVWGH